MVNITPPTVGQGAWGPALNAQLEALETAVNAAAVGAVGPTDPGPSLPPGTEYLWAKTDGNGTLLDLLTGKAS